MARARFRPPRTVLTGQGDSRDEILKAYSRAKKADPKITQGRFMMAADVGKWKNEESAARYFRLMRDDKRSGKQLWKQASGYRPGGLSDAYQVRMNDTTGNTYSFNVEMQDARSTYDIARIKAELKQHPEILDAKREEWKRRYGSKFRGEDDDEFDEEEDEDGFDVVRILKTRAPLLHLYGR